MKTLALMCSMSSLVALVGCAETTVTFLTQVPPGRTATVDVEDETLTLSRGLAVAFDCTEWVETYSGPCRNMDVSFDDDTRAGFVRAHLDALQGQTAFSRQTGFDDGQTVGGPTDRQGGLVLGFAAGTTGMTVTTDGAPVHMTVIVEDPPAPPDPEEDGDPEGDG